MSPLLAARPPSVCARRTGGYFPLGIQRSALAACAGEGRFFVIQRQLQLRYANHQCLELPNIPSSSRSMGAAAVSAEAHAHCRL